MISGVSAGVIALVSIKIPALGEIYVSESTTKINNQKQNLYTTSSIDATFGTKRDTEARVSWGGYPNYTDFKATPEGKTIYWSEPDTLVVGWTNYRVQLRAKARLSPTKISYIGVYNSN
jgi:hypothetical protein